MLYVRCEKTGSQYIAMHAMSEIQRAVYINIELGLIGINVNCVHALCWIVNQAVRHIKKLNKHIQKLSGYSEMIWALDNGKPDLQSKQSGHCLISQPDYAFHPCIREQAKI